MAHPAQKIAALRAAYVDDGLALEAAAKRLCLADSTARRWKRAARASGDDWRAARAAKALPPGALPAPATAALERLEAQLGAGLAEIRDLIAAELTAGPEGLPASWHVTAGGAVESEADQLRGWIAARLARLRAELLVGGAVACGALAAFAWLSI